MNTVNDLPTAPTIAAPVDGTAVSSLTPTLTVNNVSDPDSGSLTYNFDIADDPDFLQAVASGHGVLSGNGTTSWQAPALQENRWYYWRAQADDWLDIGPWSATARFFVNTVNDAPTAPVIIAPVNNMTIAALSTDIVVNNSADPDSTTISYFFEADTVPTFDSANIIRSGSVTEGHPSTGSGQATTNWNLSGLKENTRYYGRAKASDGSAESVWSTVVGFFVNTVNDAPTVPTLSNPSNGAGVNSFMPTLSVHNSTDPDRDSLTYDFELYSDIALTTLVSAVSSVAETQPVTSWTVPVVLSENSTYYWRSRSSDGTLTSAWMPSASFTVNTANDAPTAPQVSSPTDGSTVATLTPALAIMNAVDPDSSTLTYDFEVYSSGVLVASITGVPGDNTGITTVTLTNTLNDNTVYQWRARAFDGDRYGAWTPMAGFTVHIPKNSITAEIEFEPETLNKKSKGTWVKVEIELPKGHKASDVDISSIRLEWVVPAEAWPYEIKDCRDNECEGSEIMVKFKRSDVINILPNGEHVPVHVTGRVGAVTFEGVDVIRVIR